MSGSTIEAILACVAAVITGTVPALWIYWRRGEFELKKKRLDADIKTQENKDKVDSDRIAAENEVQRQATARENQKAAQEAESFFHESFSRRLASYWAIKIPNEQRSHLHEVLKGFVAYAELKGCRVSLSVDSSISGQLAFKYTSLYPGEELTRDEFLRLMNGYLSQLTDESVEAEQKSEFVDSDAIGAKEQLEEDNKRFRKHDGIMQVVQEFLDAIKMWFMSGKPLFVANFRGEIHMNKTKIIDSPGAASVTTSDSQGTTVNISTHVQMKQVAALDTLLQRTAKGDFSNQNVRNIDFNARSIREEIKHEKYNSSRVKEWLENLKNLVGAVGVTFEINEAIKVILELFK